MASKWSSVFSVITKLAPTLASVAAGPIGGMAVTTLESALGVKPATTSTIEDRKDAVAAAVTTATPEQLSAVQAAEASFKEQMAQFGLDEDTLTAQDTANARTMHTANRELTPSVLSYAITAGFFGLLSLLAFHAVPPAAKDLLETMVGALGTAWVAVVTFWFGSSSNSSRQTELLAKAQPVKE